MSPGTAARRRRRPGAAVALTAGLVAGPAACAGDDPMVATAGLSGSPACL